MTVLLRQPAAVVVSAAGRRAAVATIAGRCIAPRGLTTPAAAPPPPAAAATVHARPPRARVVASSGAPVAPMADHAAAAPAAATFTFAGPTVLYESPETQRHFSSRLFGWSHFVVGTATGLFLFHKLGAYDDDIRRRVVAGQRARALAAPAASSASPASLSSSPPPSHDLLASEYWGRPTAPGNRAVLAMLCATLGFGLTLLNHRSARSKVLRITGLPPRTLQIEHGRLWGPRGVQVQLEQCGTATPAETGLGPGRTLQPAVEPATGAPMSTWREWRTAFQRQYLVLDVRSKRQLGMGVRDVGARPARVLKVDREGRFPHLHLFDRLLYRPPNSTAAAAASTTAPPASASTVSPAPADPTTSP
ncbi:hypothetical protein CXG81DRAFT_23862 [Caulochytrium protostelioides]|uniref:Uncharacterized protein n=1 Tax=Caulochytrium protostelioides TaxID=1555241 RepID=A0A4P9XD90_9FUNG|nr:hypothetical protein CAUPRSCDRAFT_10714 [Caulochytrium protostelioides]RKP03466.1 hypothetical protein CXG81DRAFT_23862 [Caulochytrium protostelioides]|eukprot:RKP03466.1 hypothetical protein CXG81DRAFT_23862 [Caulochytrium protostelioides]